MNWLHLQTVNGRHRQATYVLLHLIGAAAEFAGQPRGSKMFIGDVEKARRLCGVPLSYRKLGFLLPNPGSWKVTTYLLRL